MDVQSLNKEFASLSAEQRFAEINRLFGYNATLTTSLGKYASVSLHMAKDYPMSKVFCDTTLYGEETYENLEKVKENGLHVIVLKPNAIYIPPKSQVASMPDSIKKELTEDLKSQPLREYFKRNNIKAWVAGVRRESSEYRESLDFVEEVDGILKFHPILDWTTKDCYDYAKTHNLVINESHEEVLRGDKKECGLHLNRK